MAWSLTTWNLLLQRINLDVAGACSESAARGRLVRASRRVLREFSTNFFLVTRFLPPKERADVEVIYAAVRYPDEVVDSFPIPVEEKLALLDSWEEAYRRALACEGLRPPVRTGVPWILAGFADVVRRQGIPPEHYHSFLAAMRRDARPACFPTLEALIDDYIYGSAIVVGYFLAYVYGTARGARMEDALACSRELGIALQLTNFARDVFEDCGRGRLYLPLDMLAAEALDPDNYLDPRHEVRLRRVIRRLALQAEAGYDFARRNLDVFSPGCRSAVGACVEVYGKLNRRFLEAGAPVRVRVSVNAVEKFRALPPQKYWRVPLAYAGLL
ncbi:MAG: phytoene synthase [Bryobacteraceae bacterium]|nr:MAG: phytoene synthase [Bryobacteraceae bacterium]